MFEIIELTLSKPEIDALQFEEIKRQNIKMYIDEKGRLKQGTPPPIPDYLKSESEALTKIYREMVEKEINDRKSLAYRIYSKFDIDEIGNFVLGALVIVSTLIIVLALSYGFGKTILESIR